VSPSTVSDLNKKIYGTIGAWRNRPIEGDHPYVYLDGIVLKNSWAGEVRNVSLVAIGVNERGYREILGICGGRGRMRRVGARSSSISRNVGVSANHLGCLHGLAESAAEFFLEAAWQRCVVHWYRNIFSHVPPPRCGRSRPCLRRSMLVRTSRQDARSHPSDREAAWHAPEPRRRTGGSGGRGDTHLLRLPRGALAADSHQQPARAHPARDPAAHACRGRVP
jgi:hypothetical protein